jgi:uncharacterized cupredoxin-like copper-binding protein
MAGYESGRKEGAMTSPLRKITVPALLLVSFGLLAAGCGSDGGTTTITESEGTAGGNGTGGAATLEIKMGEFYFKPANGTAKAGKTVISAPNEGSAEHELVLFRTNMSPAKLPTEKDGSVDEEKMDKIAESGGEIADVEGGESKSATFDLKPGKYVMFCNLPGHYAAGMYGTLTVTK